jgi:hypothetical protein
VSRDETPGAGREPHRDYDPAKAAVRRANFGRSGTPKVDEDDRPTGGRRVDSLRGWR